MKIILTRIQGELLPEDVVGLLGHQVHRAMPGLVLIQQVADLLDFLQQLMVVFIQQALNPAARRAFGVLMEQG